MKSFYFDFLVHFILFYFIFKIIKFGIIYYSWGVKWWFLKSIFTKFYDIIIRFDNRFRLI